MAKLTEVEFDAAVKKVTKEVGDICDGLPTLVIVGMIDNLIVASLNSSLEAGCKTKEITDHLYNVILELKRQVDANSLKLVQLQ